MDVLITQAGINEALNKSYFNTVKEANIVQTQALWKIGFEMNQTSQSAQGGTNGWADNIGDITEALSNNYFVTLREANKIVLFTFLQLQSA